jgi:hypothetical protein
LQDWGATELRVIADSDLKGLNTALRILEHKSPTEFNVPVKIISLYQATANHGKDFNDFWLYALEKTREAALNEMSSQELAQKAAKGVVKALRDAFTTKFQTIDSLRAAIEPLQKNGNGAPKTNGRYDGSPSSQKAKTGRTNGAGNTFTDAQWEELWEQWKRLVADAYGRPKSMKNPFREDKTPSAGFVEKNGKLFFHDFAFPDYGQTVEVWEKLAVAAGVISWADFKAKHAPKALPSNINSASDLSKAPQDTPKNISNGKAFTDDNGNEFSEINENGEILVKLNREKANPEQDNEHLDVRQAIEIPTPPQPKPLLAGLQSIAYGDEVYDELFGNAPVTDKGAPILFPAPCLHKLGGFAKFLQSGKVVAIMSKTGGGKTTFLEAMLDLIVTRYGITPLVYSPEWRPKELIARLVHRYSGLRDGAPRVTNDDIAGHQLYLASKGVYGKLMTKAQQAEFRYVLDTRKQLAKGNSFVIVTRENGARGRMVIEDVLAFAAAEFDKHSDPNQPRVLFLDYLQLLRARERGTNGEVGEMAAVMQEIKGWAEEHGAQVFLVTQATKEAGRAANNGAGMTSESAQSARLDAANLILEIKLIKDEGLPHAKLRVIKNSNGASYEEVTCEWDPERMLIVLDKESR